jgi:hypothetical protein
MFSLDRALFLNHLKYIGPFFAVLFVFCWYFHPQRNIPGMVIVILCIVWLVMAVLSRTNIRLQREIHHLRMTDLYRDYLLADKVSGFAIGEKFFYWWEGPVIYLLSYQDIDRIYAAKTEYDTDDGMVSEKHYLCVRDTDGNEYTLKCHPNRQKALFLHLIELNAPVRLGYR